MTTKTYRLRGSDIDRKWHVLDASGRAVGRVASDAARLLLGKHKPTYEPHLAMGDHVIVVNAGEVILTGNKASQKIYYRHSGHPGNLHERSFEQQMARDPRKVIETAVRGMLPHNVRGRELFRHLRVYAGPDHPHEAQVMAGTGARVRRRAAAAARAKAAASAPPVDEAPSAPPVDEALPAPPVDEAPPAPPVDEAPPAPPVDEAPPAPPVDEAPSAPPVDEAPPAPPVDEAPPEPTDAEAVMEPSSDAAPARLTGSLARYRRDELDAEAERLGITSEDGWMKSDVVDAVAAYYEANPLSEEE